MINVPQNLRLKNTIKYPTTLIVGGLNQLGMELADSLIKQGGYVVIVDSVSEDNIEKFGIFEMDDMISFLDYTSIPHLEEDIRRLDYVFYFSHESIDFHNQVSTQEFLTFSNYLDASLSLAAKFEARFLLTTSIKANQIYYAENKIDYSFTAKSFHAYTDMEVQRYAEGLTMEYNEKVDLNARIVRVGEIIGEGMDFGANTTFTNMILSAVRGERLLLENDGLENEWFVHILDAAYGLIKAQFSKDTNGETYSLAIENNYTHLSIAYKIQELEPDAKEIQFVESKNMTPNIKIHKPAQNLSKIGWMPRVSFDKGVKQSLAAAKIFVLEEGINELENVTTNQDHEPKTISEKVLSFFSIAKNSDEDEEEDKGSAIDKLIEKRKQELNDRKDKLGDADMMLKVRKRVRPMSTGEKIRKKFWTNMYAISKVFTVFSNKSPVELGLLIFGGILFILAYFFIVSPMLVITRNTLIIIPEYKQAGEYLAVQEFGSYNDSVEKISNSLDENIRIFSKYRGLFSFISMGSTYNEFLNLLNRYSEVTSALKDISYAIEPYSEYLDKFENNLQIRSSTESYLSIVGGGIDYSPILDSITDRKAFLDEGITRANIAIEELRLIDTSKLPPFLDTQVEDINKKLFELSDTLKSFEHYATFPELLGNTKPRTYFIGIIDNTRPTPLGGDLAAYAMITINNGSFEDIVIQPIESLDIELNNLVEADIDSINNTRYTYIEPDTIKTSDLTSIINLESFKGSMNNTIEESIGRQVDGVFFLDLNSLDNLANAISIGAESKINGVEFGEGSIYRNIINAMSGNESLTARHDVIAKATAWIFYESINNWKNNNVSFFEALISSTKTQSIRGYSDIAELRDFILKENLDRISIYSADTFIIPILRVDDPKVITNDSIPNVTITLDTTINANYSIDQELTMSFPSVGTSQEVGVCLPGDISISSIKVLGTNSNAIPSERVTINNEVGEICVVGQSITDTIFSISWKTPSLALPGLTNVKLDIGIGKMYGIETKFDHKIQVEDGLQLQSLDNIEVVNNESIYRNDLLKDYVLEVDVLKP